MTDNERASQGPLAAGLIASGERLAALTPVLRACPVLEVRAQAGMPQGAALPDIPWFDDTRVLISQPGLQIILLASSTRVDVEAGATAAEHGLHVWRLPPLARSFGEAVETARRAKRADAVYHVASWWEHVVDHAWREIQWPGEFKALFSELRISAQGPALHSWRASLADAGGGALASDGYPMLEALVAVRGLPESIVGAVGHYRNEAARAAREAEDAGVAILRYAGGGAAVIRAAWDLWPIEQQTVHHGQDATVTLTDGEVRVADATGTVVDRHALPGDFLGAELLRFVDLVRGNARDRAVAALERHLAVSALLETIYLSAQTNHPESPRRLYEAQGWPEPRS